MINGAISSSGSCMITVRADNDTNGLGDFTSTATGTLTSAGGSVTILGGVNTTVGGVISTTAGGSVSLTATLGSLAVNAMVSAVGGDGSVTTFAGDNIMVTAAISVAGAGQIIASADVANDGIGDFVNSGTGTLMTAGGDVAITAQDIDLGAAINVTTGAMRDVFLLTRDPADVINLGTDTGFGLTDADLDQITAGVLNVGSAGTNTAGISITSQITQAGSGYTTLSLETAGAITENTGTEQTDITITNLALRANAGLGTAMDGDLDIAVTNLAFSNTLMGAVSITNAGALTINAVDGLMTSFNSGSTTITANSPLTFAVNTTSVGDGVYTAGEINDSPGFADDVTVNMGATVSATAGNLTLQAGDDVVLNAGSMVSASGSVTLVAGFNDLDNHGDLILNGTITAGNGLSLTAFGDIVLGSLSATGALSITSTTGNILDDGIDTTFIQATNISLSAGGRIGGMAPIGTADLESVSTATPSAAFLGAIDVNFTGTLTLAQTGLGGNVQIRQTGSGLSTGNVMGIGGLALGMGNQLALISSGGDLTVNSPVTVSVANNANLLLATTGGNDVSITTGSVVNNGSTAVTTLAATGSTLASINAPTPDNLADVTAQSLVLFTTGGDIGMMGNPLEFDAVTLNGQTTGMVMGMAQPGGSAFLADTATGLAVGQFNAGTGDVALASRGNGANGSLVSVTPNDNIAEILGDMISIDTTAAPSNGATGQIGFVMGGVQFFEVNANVINASTNNSRLWISEVGSMATAGAQVGLISAGTENAILRVRNGGSLTSAMVDGTADVVGTLVSLSALEGGSFGGMSASPLEINATTLTATVTGTGNVNILDVLGGVTVQRATTGTGSVQLAAAGMGAGLTLGNASSTVAVVSATTSATLSATGAITSGAPMGVLDVTASTLALTSGTGAGTAMTPLETTVATLAATGGVAVNNTGNLVIGTVAGLTGVSASTGDISVSTTGGLTVTNNVMGAGNIALTAASGLLQTTGNVTTTGGTASLNSSAGALQVGGMVSATGSVVLMSSGNLSTTGTVSSGAGVTANTTTSALQVGGAITGATGVTLMAGGNLTVMAGVTSTGGNVAVTSAGTLQASGNVSGPIVNLTTTAAITAGQDIVVDMGVTVFGTTISLNAGDNVTVNGSVTSAIGGTVSIAGDVGNA